MNVPAGRVQEILGLKGVRGEGGLAAAVEKGLPRGALVRAVGRTGLTGIA